MQKHFTLSIIYLYSCPQESLLLFPLFFLLSLSLSLSSTHLFSPPSPFYYPLSLLLYKPPSVSIYITFPLNPTSLFSSSPLLPLPLSAPLSVLASLVHSPLLCFASFDLISPTAHRRPSGAEKAEFDFI